MESRSLKLENADLLAISTSNEMAVLRNRRYLGWYVSRGTLARMPIDGSAARDLLEDVQEADWAPDGNKLAVIRWVNGQNQLEYPIGKVLYKTAGYLSHPRISPNGDLVAFMDHQAQWDNRGWVAVVDLSEKKTVLSGEWEGEEGLAWSPAGDEVWFTASKAGEDDALYAVTLFGRERLVLRMTSRLTLHDISRTGRMLITSSEDSGNIIGQAPGETKERDLSWLDQGRLSALSSDGKTILFSYGGEGSGINYAVYFRHVNATQVRVLPGTKGAAYPFWSPDGREIGFFSENQLNRIALDGVAPRTIAAVTDPRGGAWGAGDIILIGSSSGPIQRVPASGGKRPEPITELEKGLEASHDWPAFLPDGKQFVFLADAHTDEGHHIRLGSVEGGPTKILRNVVRSQPLVDPAGRLLLCERGQLLAYPFDLVHGTLGEESTLIAAPIFTIGNEHHLPASASVRGMVAFQTGSAENNLVMLDQAGRVTRTVGATDRYGNMAVSPDGKRVAFEIFTDTSEKLIWVEDLERGVRSPVSQRGKLADSPAWSADGETVYFDSSATGKWEAYRKAVTGGGAPENLGSPNEAKDVAVLDLSPDGRWLLISALNEGSRYDLYLRSLDGAGKWVPWAFGPANERAGAFSPDSHWIAYTSDDSGRVEVYVAPVEGGSAAHRWPISSGGGFEPRFSADGKMIYYRSAAFDWTAVEVRLDPRKVEAGTPKKLFPMPAIDLPYLRNLMALLPGGKGFMSIHPPSTKPMSIHVRTGK
jgi:Tol biopolymer transport system component